MANGPDNGWEEPSPSPPPVTDGRPTTTRAKRDSLRSSLRTQAKRLVPLLGTLIAVLVTSWTMRLQVQVEAVEDRADGAAAKGEKGERVAKVATVEARAGYVATAEKVDATGDVTAELATRLKLLEEEVERLKAAKTGRKPRRRSRAVKVPSVVTTPLPETPADAAKEQGQSP